jgi:hypothetical protein
VPPVYLKYTSHTPSHTLPCLQYISHASGTSPTPQVHLPRLRYVPRASGTSLSYPLTPLAHLQHPTVAINASFSTATNLIPRPNHRIIIPYNPAESSHPAASTASPASRESPASLASLASTESAESAESSYPAASLASLTSRISHISRISRACPISSTVISSAPLASHEPAQSFQSCKPRQPPQSRHPPSLTPPAHISHTPTHFKYFSHTFHTPSHLQHISPIAPKISLQAASYNQSIAPNHTSSNKNRNNPSTLAESIYLGLNLSLPPGSHTSISPPAPAIPAPNRAPPILPLQCSTPK